MKVVASRLHAKCSQRTGTSPCRTTMAISFSQASTQFKVHSGALMKFVLGLVHFLVIYPNNDSRGATYDEIKEIMILSAT